MLLPVFLSLPSNNSIASTGGTPPRSDDYYGNDKDFRRPGLKVFNPFRELANLKP